MGRKKKSDTIQGNTPVSKPTQPQGASSSASSNRKPLSDMSNDQRLLWCLIDTDIDIESIPFELTVPINASVSRLKELVWEKGKNGVLGNVDAKNLVLYKVITF